MSAETDANGNYRIKHRAGTYTVSVTVGDDYEDPGPQTVTVPPGGNVVADFVLKRKGTISGSVKDDAGNPVAGVTVAATPQP